MKVLCTGGILTLLGRWRERTLETVGRPRVQESKREVDRGVDANWWEVDEAGTWRGFVVQRERGAQSRELVRC